MLRADLLCAEEGLGVIPAEARGAWREIETRLRPWIARRVTSPSDVDDVVQDVFVRMHRGLADLQDEQSFGGWVYRVAAHAVSDHQRARGRHPLPKSADDAAPEVPFEPLEEGLDGELTACVAMFVARLPSPYREAITLTELEGMTQAKAAEMLGISVSGMKSRVQRGRERIRHMFEACCELQIDARGRVTECTPRDVGDVREDCRGAAVAWSERRRC